MTKTAIRVTRAITVPDPVRVARAQRSPDLGPRILFFTGGTALKETSQALVGYTHNSTHLVTPFDSGGSSAVLRKYFGMPAVGDLRNRLMALADRTLHGFPEIYDLFAHRLPKTASPDQLQTELRALVSGSHPLIARVSDPMRKIIRHHLQIFEKSISTDFDLRGASIGNLILTAGYLENRRHIDPIVYIYSKLVQVRGEVRLVVNSDLQLRAVLENGDEIIGQHLITGKETPALTVPIKELSLTDPARRGSAVRPAIRDKIRAGHDLGPDLLSHRQLLQFPRRQPAPGRNRPSRKPDPLPQGLRPQPRNGPGGHRPGSDRPGPRSAAPSTPGRIQTPSPSATCSTLSCSIRPPPIPARVIRSGNWPSWACRSSARPFSTRTTDASIPNCCARPSSPWPEHSKEPSWAKTKSKSDPSMS
jgi:2-phospho-L-lactate transferase/gluconeogenesis factor (CofD/UPF0052 family)